MGGHNDVVTCTPNLHNVRLRTIIFGMDFETIKTNKNEIPVIEIASPHYSRFSERPNVIVIHYTAGGSARSSAEWFRNPKSKASAHFIIPRHPGKTDPVIQCVPLSHAAWHAGSSEMYGKPHVSRFSYGIELANYGPVIMKENRPTSMYGTPVERAVKISNKWWEKFPEEQIYTLGALVAELIKRIQTLGDSVEVLGHSDVAIPAGRKIDPGPAFPWVALAAAVEEHGVKVNERNGVFFWHVNGRRLN